ncbi:non-specific lipid transfer protein GPI-anchored 14-like [Actinidia eriantha]|uniref:non-specific lipid transfer protein GPI-anchored 14-like n=1 Tax=Actinidia eriantha TaxID=165200 RepID=UPI00258F5050|nr:non-specific lipid transfer protein GPI-anchored 14-like [Actinidia eriantha]
MAILARILCILLFLLIVGHVSSDLAEDTKQCQDQLIGLSPCQKFVSGDSKSPSTSCCSELRKDYNKTKRCLCVIVKDRNEPKLGLKINATLALSLPYVCYVPHANASDCPALLNLAPHSPDAKVFEQFSNISSLNDDNTGTRDIPTSSTDTVKRVGIKVSLWLIVISLFTLI